MPVNGESYPCEYRIMPKGAMESGKLLTDMRKNAMEAVHMLQVFSNNFIRSIYTGVIAMAASEMYILELDTEDPNILLVMRCNILSYFPSSASSEE
ncbi:hypothetical protein FNV43_RR10692 [Rhamnella rubrinervis]|uniref:Uncharacterized protein n=1 Tax=Rhamnella rubrinervis TaxID=2594499 RepID=A0A8K0H478_9ROSA|nr:hypothetical protein FNV43_RR10692 [Rhamnella rubrinervis]